jgi:hypothetical protein
MKAEGGRQNHARNLDMVYLLFRVFVGLMVLGLLMVPGMMVLHLWGLWAALLLVALGLAVFIIYVARRVWLEKSSLASLLTRECDTGWQLHPALTVIAGLIFAAGGCWIFAAPSAGPNAMSHLEQAWFGTIFLLTGTGVVGTGLSMWRAQSNESTRDERPGKGDGGGEK